MMDRPLPAIVIPIHNAPAEVDACIAAVLRHTPGECRIILIDDASDDARTEEVLAKYRGRRNLDIHRLDINVGYTKAVNLGIEVASRLDVVLLNSDTKVTPGWLGNLQRAVYSGDRIATATPFSNNAGAFSVPDYGKANPIPDWLSLNDYARLVTQCSKRVYPEVPTGSGFCMYIRRECIDEVGAFDATAFPRGYGEENDFCMRSGRLGWKHVIDDATLIEHVRSASFGAEKSELVKQGRAVIDERYPEYKRLIRVFEDGAALSNARRRIAAAIAESRARLHPALRRKPGGPSAVRRFVQKKVRRAFRAAFPRGIEAARELKRQQDQSPSPNLAGTGGGGSSRILFVVATETGGTPQTNQDLMNALKGRYECFVLRSNAKTLTLQRFNDGVSETLREVRLPTWLQPFPHVDPTYDQVLTRWLREYRINIVHIRHIVWHSLSLSGVASSLGIPVVFSFHDFYAVCPTIRLVDENDTFCGGDCTATPGQCRYELWRKADFPPLKHVAVHSWRQQMSAMLSNCDAFVTTSEGARSLIQRFFPLTIDKPFEVIEHGRDFESFGTLGAFPQRDERVRVLLPGNISVSKGARILQRMQALNRDGRFEFHLIGSYAPELRGTPNVVFHGIYNREDFGRIARSILPHFGAILSIWPETFCHTLTEMWALGLPVVAFDLGAVGDRVSRHGGGWAVGETTAEAMFGALSAIAYDPADFQARLDEVARWQAGPGASGSCSLMAAAYERIYRELLDNRFQTSRAMGQAAV